jgi:hypothetical protein
MKKLTLALLLAVATTNASAIEQRSHSAEDLENVIITEINTKPKQAKGLLHWIKNNPGKIILGTAALAVAAAAIDTALSNNVKCCNHEKFFWNKGCDWVYETVRYPFVQAYSADDVKTAQEAFVQAETAAQKKAYDDLRASINVESNSGVVTAKQRVAEAEKQIAAAEQAVATAAEDVELAAQIDAQALKTAAEKAKQQAAVGLEGATKAAYASVPELTAAHRALDAAQNAAVAKIHAVAKAGEAMAQAETALKTATDKAAAQEALNAARTAWEKAKKDAPNVARTEAHFAKKDSNVRVFFVDNPVKATGAVVLSVAGAAAVFDLTRGNKSKIKQMLGLTKKAKRTRRPFAALAA